MIFFFFQDLNILGDQVCEKFNIPLQDRMTYVTVP